MPRNAIPLGLLALVLAGMAASPSSPAPVGPGPHEAVIGMDELPTNAKIRDLLRRTDPTRPNQDPQLYNLLERHLRDKDLADLRRCRALVVRKRYDHLAGDRLWPRRCQNEMWCPKCSRIEWYKRKRYHIQKFRSISPERHLCCFHLVFTLPDLLTPILLKSPRAREEFIWAAWSAMHRSWDGDAPELDARGAYRSQRRFSESFGALINVHPWGDERKNRSDPRKPVWPVWRPHLDIIMAGYRIEDGRLVELRPTWPCRFRKLRAYYREALRAAFVPLLGHLPMEEIPEAYHHLQSEFPVVCWVSPAGGGKDLHREGQAVKRIEYSSRSLWDPSRVIVDYEAGVGDVVIYPTQGGRARHRVPARQLFPHLYELREHVVGNTQAHRWWGFFGNNRYAKTARAAGNEPVVEHPRTGGRVIESYYPNHQGEYDPVHQVIRPGLGRDRDSGRSPA